MGDVNHRDNACHQRLFSVGDGVAECLNFDIVAIVSFVNDLLLRMVQLP